jgi:GMP synthase-like glutamine amidotransferase
MPRNRIDDLRNHLFETLEALKDKDEPMDLDRAKAVAEVAKVLIETAKVEVDFMRVTNSTNGTGFLPDANEEAKPVTRRIA